MKCTICTLLAVGVLLCGGRAFAQTQTVAASEEPLLTQYDESNREYMKLQIDDVVSYFHQRKLGEATVEGDFQRFQFDLKTGALLDSTIEWRADLPDAITPLITRAQAEAQAEGKVDRSRLWIISPKSYVFPLSPTPANPCWVVHSYSGSQLTISIIDAVTGEFLGYGIPPPYEGFSITGPDWGGACAPLWPAWAANARTWFENWGYTTEFNGSVTDAQVQAHIQSDSIAVFYELCHGGSWDFHNICPDTETITAAEIQTWMTSYAHMPFTFLGSCDGMCNQTTNHLSFEFRKGANDDTATVGYCGMSEPACDLCWGRSIDWQTDLFQELDTEHSVQAAFNHANLAFPDCPNGNCMRTAGDTALTLVPVVRRSLCGNIYDGRNAPLTAGARDHYIRCNSAVPVGHTLTVNARATVAFLNDSILTCSGTLNADAMAGSAIRFVSAADKTRGMRLITGQLLVQHNGQIRVHE